MSNKFTTKQIQDQFASLPADMQSVISSANTAELIQSIGAKHEMRIDAIGVLIEYSGLMMLGLIDSDTFINTIAKEAGVSREKAANIVLDIDTQVFSQVRNSLRNVQYSSTSDNRFEQGNDFEKPKPTTPSVNDILPANDPVVQKETDEITQPIDPSILDSAFTVSQNQSSKPIEIQLNTSNATNQMDAGFSSAATDATVNQSISQSVTKGMPQAMKDAYKSGNAAAPAPNVSDELVKDFQTKLEEKIASADTSLQNSDPYKESI